MREFDFEIPLDDDRCHFVFVAMKFGAGLEDYVIVYYAVEGGRRVPLVCFDLSHGFPHKDLRYLPKKDKRRKQRLAPKPLQELFDESLEDIRSNWRRYYEEYLRCRK
ncbi:MAG: hypothetical protein V1834_01060 [Candidatus Micrarchaeota archaeon]